MIRPGNRYGRLRASGSSGGRVWLSQQRQGMGEWEGWMILVQAWGRLRSKWGNILAQVEVQTSSQALPVLVNLQM